MIDKMGLAGGGQVTVTGTSQTLAQLLTTAGLSFPVAALWAEFVPASAGVYFSYTGTATTSSALLPETGGEDYVAGRESALAFITGGANIVMTVHPKGRL